MNGTLSMAREQFQIADSVVGQCGADGLRARAQKVRLWLALTPLTDPVRGIMW
jgi:hypothetical protein